MGGGGEEAGRRWRSAGGRKRELTRLASTSARSTARPASTIDSLRASCSCASSSLSGKSPPSGCSSAASSCGALAAAKTAVSVAAARLGSHTGGGGGRCGAVEWCTAAMTEAEKGGFGRAGQQR